MGDWVTFPLAGELNKNVDGATLVANAATIENCYVNEAKALSRFQQLSTFVDLGAGDRPVFLREYNNDLVAVCGGRFYQVYQDGTFVDVTGAPVEGGKRVIFAETEDELCAAAGRQIIKFDGVRSSILSEEAPESTHIGWLGSYLVAMEKDSGRFQFSSADSFYRTWDPLNILSAEGAPDDLNAILVTEFGQLILAGEDSIEQHDPSPSGDTPFYKRWQLGEGLYAPYTMINADNRVWGVDSNKDFVAYSTQVGSVFSSQIQNRLEQIDSWKDAFAMELPIKGQRFIVLQMPDATNDYGTKGVTMLYDYKHRHWSELYGFDNELKLPARWEGWSYAEIGNRKFIGGNGKIHLIGGFAGETVQKMVWRSGHVNMGGGQFSIEKLRLKAKRGHGAVGETPAIISLRANKDNRGFGRYVRRDLGRAGKSFAPINYGSLGIGYSFQLELEITDPIEVELMDIEMYVERMDE